MFRKINYLSSPRGVRKIALIQGVSIHSKFYILFFNLPLQWKTFLNMIKFYLPCSFFIITPKIFNKCFELPWLFLSSLHRNKMFHFQQPFWQWYCFWGAFCVNTITSIIWKLSKTVLEKHCSNRARFRGGGHRSPLSFPQTESSRKSAHKKKVKPLKKSYGKWNLS